MKIWILVVFVFTVLLGCESKNEHFCSKYSYFYEQLTAPGILPLSELRRQLEADIRSSNADQERAKMALFVLADVEVGIKPLQETPREYCMRRQLWQRYR